MELFFSEKIFLFFRHFSYLISQLICLFNSAFFLSTGRMQPHCIVFNWLSLCTSRSRGKLKMQILRYENANAKAARKNGTKRKRNGEKNGSYKQKKGSGKIPLFKTAFRGFKKFLRHRQRREKAFFGRNKVQGFKPKKCKTKTAKMLPKKCKQPAKIRKHPKCKRTAKNAPACLVLLA